MLPPLVVLLSFKSQVITHCNTLQHTATHCNVCKMLPPHIAVAPPTATRGSERGIHGTHDTSQNIEFANVCNFSSLHTAVAPTWEQHADDTEEYMHGVATILRLPKFLQQITTHYNTLQHILDGVATILRLPKFLQHITTHYRPLQHILDGVATIIRLLKFLQHTATHCNTFSIGRPRWLGSPNI